MVKHCNQGAKPLEGIGRAASKCSGLGPQPPGGAAPKAERVWGAQRTKMQGVRGAQLPWMRGSGGQQRPREISAFYDGTCNVSK